MKLQKKTRWILFSVCPVLLIIGVVYTTILWKNNLLSREHLPTVQVPENAIKEAVLQELSQQKKKQRREQQITDSLVQVNLKRLSEDKHWVFGVVAILAPILQEHFQKGNFSLQKKWIRIGKSL
ncbi:hypothetical protein [Bacillus thuringiensis]|uniref:hypothetical protein n=1 Tax=Bacillus thuringiensis TaxID=1428 RepID=UPI00159BB3E7|nr:hypothetical protein [Bacillus thuringiensis]